MDELYALDENFSIAKLSYKLIDNRYLNEDRRIKEEYKFKLNFPEFGIVDSKIPAKKDEKFDTLLFLPKGERRKGEGGLRTKGYFKFSYKLVNGKEILVNGSSEKTVENAEKNNNSWWIVGYDDKPIKQVILPRITNHQLLTTNHYPLITIITVVYNGEKYLEETIQSVINQTYPNVEYIIIDGGSTDGTLDIIKKYEDKIDYWVSEKDSGIYDAMNKGVSLSTGQWVYFLGSDDILCRGALLKLNFNSNYKAIYGDVYMPGKHRLYDGKFNKFKIMFKNICHQSIFYNRKIFKNHRFSLRYSLWADYDLNLKIFNKEFLYVPILVAFFNDIDGKSSVCEDEVFKKERKSLIKENLGLVFLCIYVVVEKVFRLLKFILKKTKSVKI